MKLVVLWSSKYWPFTLTETWHSSSFPFLWSQLLQILGQPLKWLLYFRLCFTPHNMQCFPYNDTARAGCPLISAPRLAKTSHFIFIALNTVIQTASLSNQFQQKLVYCRTPVCVFPHIAPSLTQSAFGTDVLLCVAAMRCYLFCCLYPRGLQLCKRNGEHRNTNRYS